MRRIIHVLTIEHDFFARNWMAMLFARDWRTRIIGEVGSLDRLDAFAESCPDRVDMVLINTASAPSRKQQAALLKTLQHCSAQTRVIWLGDVADPAVFGWLPQERVAGFLLKSEIRYSLAWALAIGQDQWVLTPGVQEAAFQAGFALPKHAAILDGTRPVANLTEHESEVARFALIFSMERRDLADEMGISEDWGYGLVSALYKKLGLVEVLSGEVDPVLYLGTHPLISEHLKGIVEQLGQAKKARDMETLAFHLMTMPEILELG